MFSQEVKNIVSVSSSPLSVSQNRPTVSLIVAGFSLQCRWHLICLWSFSLEIRWPGTNKRTVWSWCLTGPGEFGRAAVWGRLCLGTWGALVPERRGAWRRGREGIRGHWVWLLLRGLLLRGASSPSFHGAERSPKQLPALDIYNFWCFAFLPASQAF